MDGCGFIKHEFSSASKFYNSTLMSDLITTSGTINASNVVGTCFFGDGDLNEALNIKSNLNDINQVQIDLNNLMATAPVG